MNEWIFVANGTMDDNRVWYIMQYYTRRPVIVDCFTCVPTCNLVSMAVYHCRCTHIITITLTYSTKLYEQLQWYLLVYLKTKHINTSWRAYTWNAISYQFVYNDIAWDTEDLCVTIEKIVSVGKDKMKLKRTQNKACHSIANNHNTPPPH